MKTRDSNSKYQRALKHVNEVKELYQQLLVYAIFLIIWFFFNDKIIEFHIANTGNTDSDFLNWFNSIIPFIPILWGCGLIFQFLYLYRFKMSFYRNWEERKIKELLKKDEF